MFTRKGLSVRPLEVTDQVIVEDIRHFNEDLLQLYFEKEGGSVEHVVLNEAEQSVTITFENYTGRAFTVLIKCYCHQSERIPYSVTI